MLHSRPMALRIPKEEQNGLVTILDLNPQMVDELIAALAEGHSLKASDLSTIVKSKTAINSDDIKAIVDTIISLYGARAYFGYSVQDFIDELYESMRESGVDRLSIYAKSDVTKATLERILSVDSLGTAMKAQAVLREYERSYCDARILTDLRPVFGSNAEERPVGASVVHNLRIAYHERNDLKEFFVAMSDDDIEELLEALTRAKTKSGSLGSVLTVANIRQLDFK